MSFLKWYRRRPLWLFIPVLAVPVLWYGYDYLTSSGVTGRYLRDVSWGGAAVLLLVIFSAVLAVLLLKLVQWLTGGRRSSIAEIAARDAAQDEEKRP